MKKLRKLNLQNNADVLSANEMKIISGGYDTSFSCIRDNGETFHTFENIPFSLGYKWCDFWSTAGWKCTCFNNY